MQSVLGLVFVEAGMARIEEGFLSESVVRMKIAHEILFYT